MLDSRLSVDGTRAVQRALLLLLIFSAGCDFGMRPRPLAPEQAQAANALVERLERDPKDGRARLELGQVYLDAKRYFQAADQLKYAVDLMPGEQKAYAGLADAYLKLNFYQQSFDALVRCAQTVGQNEDCLIRIGDALKSEGTKEALQQAATAYRRALSMAPNHPDAPRINKALADIAAQAGALPETATATPTANVPPPGHPTIPEHEGAEGEEPVGALNPFGAAIGRALDAVKNKDAAAAEKALNEALALSPKDVGANAFLAETYLAQGRMNDAIPQAEKAYQLDPQDSQARWVLGLVYIRTAKDMKKGVQVWQDLARDDPKYAEQAGVTKTLEQVQQMLKAQQQPPTK
ncbi:MAG: tetratricopeptide repeat protein [Myxococcota bacterium]